VSEEIAAALNSLNYRMNIVGFLFLASGFGWFTVGYFISSLVKKHNGLCEDVDKMEKDRAQRDIGEAVERCHHDELIGRIERIERVIDMREVRV
jgi:hypothetical protein